MDTPAFPADPRVTGSFTPPVVTPYMPVDPPCSRQEAVSRALLVAAERSGQYLLGTGDYRTGLVDRPWTPDGHGNQGSDCAGFAICYAWKLRRHRPGYNHGPWADVEDDVNCNSCAGDADHMQQLAIPHELTPRPDARPGIEYAEGPVLPGDLLMYPTIRLQSPHGPLTFIGHVGMVAEVTPSFDVAKRNYGALRVVQCHGPDGFKPGAVLTDGSIWQNHDENWPKPEHRTRIIRMKERP